MPWAIFADVGGHLGASLRAVSTPLAVALVCAAVPAGPGRAGEVCPRQWSAGPLVLADDASVSDIFGRAISADAARMLVGANHDDEADTNAGAAYVFRREGPGWVQEAKLLASDPAREDRFGVSVALDGDVALIGAYRHDHAGSDAGAAYVFRRDGGVWVEEAELVAADAQPLAWFGFSVAVTGETAFAGAYLDGEMGTEAGAVYVYEPDGAGGEWMQVAKLTASDASAGQWFGFSVAAEGEWLVIGAPHDAERGVEAGAGYVYRRVGGVWVEEAKLIGSDVQAGHEFGRSVAVGGNVLVVGAPEDSEAGGGAGAAYVFEFDGSAWQEVGKLLPPAGQSGAEFGRSGATDGWRVLIGATGARVGGLVSGSAYVFRKAGGGWSMEAELPPAEPEAFAAYGWAVALAGSEAAVGSPVDNNEGGVDAGSVQIHESITCAGDVNGDCGVDIVDFTTFAACFQGAGVPCSGSCCEADLDGDGDVDLADFSLFAGAFGTGCP